MYCERGEKKKSMFYTCILLPPTSPRNVFLIGKKNPWSDVGVSDGLKDTDEDCSV